MGLVPLLRDGIHFVMSQPHERAHLAPLQRRLQDLRAGDAAHAKVVVSATSRPPVKDAWDVQIFHGLGDKGYTLNPIFLQTGRFPRLRTALNMALRTFHLPAPFLRPPQHPGQRPSRYQQVNAYGPRFRDALETMLSDVEVSCHGHVALNELGAVEPDPDGPILWLPTWDNRRFLGGPAQSSLAPFAHEVALTSRHVPFRVKYHPLTLAHKQDADARAELERAPGVDVVSAEKDPYSLLRGIRGVVTDTSSIGFEAYCLGLPVALARPTDFRYKGLHQELAVRVPVMSSGKPDLLSWAEQPPAERDQAWIDDMLFRPASTRNDEFAAELRARV